MRDLLDIGRKCCNSIDLVCSSVPTAPVTPILRLTRDDDEYSIFRRFFTDAVIDLVLSETNRAIRLLNCAARRSRHGNLAARGEHVVDSVHLPSGRCAPAVTRTKSSLIATLMHRFYSTYKLGLPPSDVSKTDRQLEEAHANAMSVVSARVRAFINANVSAPFDELQEAFSRVSLAAVGIIDVGAVDEQMWPMSKPTDGDYTNIPRAARRHRS